MPIAVAAVTSDRLAAQGVSGPSGLTVSVPGLVFNRIANDANIYVRGIGTNLYGPNAEQTVALYVDGVYHASPEGANFSFNNIERVEVLKGPQGTLFGRNTTGGVVQIITKDPSAQPALDMSIGYGNYAMVNASLYATGGLTDTLAVDVAATYANQGGGYGRNIANGEKTGLQARHDYAIRSKALWRPADGTKIVLQGDLSRSTNTDSHQIPKGIIGVDGVSTYPGRYGANMLFTDYIRQKARGASATITQALGDVDLVSISAYRKNRSFYVIDQDATPLVASDDLVISLTRTFSQEVQLQSKTPGPLTWQLGGFYYFSHAGFEPIAVSTPIGRIAIDAFQRTRSFAGFAQASYELFPDTKITGGLRYTYEKQTLVTNDFSVFGTSIPLPSQDQSFKKMTFRISIDHKFSSNVLGYVSFNRGFKSGGYNLADPAGAGFRPETLDAFEGGLKTQLFDRRLRLNSAAFYYNYRDIQAAIPRAGGTVVTNGPKARVIGAEFDFEAHVTPAFILSGGATYLSTKYLRYPNAPFISAGGVLTSGDAKGNRLLGAAPITASLGAEYHLETRFGEIVPAIALSYNDGYYFYSDNRLKQPSYTLLNPSISWTSADARYSFKLYARNLLNETYYLNRSEQAGLTDVQRAAPPRTYGGSLSVHF
ncbi:TonB-dependent receptor [Sphingomonas sp. Root710]|uniref:TonB-dependent receptor n=1 Tax=Sphingomonas sp. Root710 TaxID=1736594 RepID=UPI00191044A1|nr:TonB-dependent receptor [Sphingomonas sp. Root710]